MAHGEAEHGSAESEQQHYLLGEHGLPARHLRWVCEAGPQPVEESVPSGAPEVASGASGPAPSDASGAQPAPLADASPDEGRTIGPEQRGPAVCRSSQAGWAGAHRHGAVRPRARTLRRERPPDRWC